MKTYIGIDNGISGSIGVIYPDGKYYYQKTPVLKELSYTKKKQYISRVDHGIFFDLMQDIKNNSQCIFAFIERPLVNSGKFKPTMSAMRCLESELIVLEQLKIPFQYIDSKEWQKALLPEGVKGSELKDASRMIGIRLFPEAEETIIEQKDADGILIAEYARRKQL